MMQDDEYLTNIAESLTWEGSQSDSSKPFCAEAALSFSDISLQVKGVGDIGFPLTQEVIDKLIQVSSKAKFGLRDKTILDESVRYTQEITGEQLSITPNKTAWENVLNSIRDGLGLESRHILKAEPHNLLIYMPGQFFEAHQDTEKSDNMIATLVVVLPSSHIGGDLIVNHGKLTHTFSSESINIKVLKCFAFYADCQHKVTPVKDGYRVVLTYNLVVETKRDTLERPVNQKLKRAISDYFSTDVGSEETQKLVYFLDHSYSEHGLRWNLLKGADYTNVQELLAVAKELNLIPHLALVEIHESWCSFNGEYSEEDFEPNELIDSGIELSYWIDMNNHVKPFKKCFITDNEICYRTATNEFEPYNSEYEGFMGNYGNTMDYWYRRAAMVLWPAKDATQMAFWLNHEEAMNDLLDLTKKPNNEQKILSTIQAAGNKLHDLTRHGFINSYDKLAHEFKRFVTIACYMKDPKFSFSLLEVYPWEVLEQNECYVDLAELQLCYGVEFCLDILKRWLANLDKETPCLLSQIDDFVLGFLTCAKDTQVPALVLQTQLAAIVVEDEQSKKLNRPLSLKKVLSDRIKRIEQFLNAAEAIGQHDLISKIVNHMISDAVLYPDLALTGLLVNINQQRQTIFPEYQLLKTHVKMAIDKVYKAGLRSDTDWSIEADLSCDCNYCQIAKDFLHNKDHNELVWAIAMRERKHILDIFYGSGLPLEFSVRKEGSPHKLVIVKTAALHKEAREEYHALMFHKKQLFSEETINA